MSGTLLLAVLLGLCGSALFSGSETGLYRVTRVRLVLDALAGDRLAAALLWLVNRPALFVATALVGNNIVNYLLELAIVVAAQRGNAGGPHGLAQYLYPLLLTPVIFICGELLPKSLFYQAPYRLLRRTGPVFLVFAVILAPASAVLYAIGKLLERVWGSAPELIKVELARKELQQLIEEGHQAGLLRPAQRHLAQGMFALANQPVRQMAVPLRLLAVVRNGIPREELLRTAERTRAAWLLVYPEAAPQQATHYVRTIEVQTAPPGAALPLRPLLTLPAGETHLGAMVRLQSTREPLARVVDEQGQTLGILTVEDLCRRLFREGR